jgi:hypothetical protein
MGYDCRIFRSDRFAAQAEARRLAARHFDVEVCQVHVVRSLPLMDADGPFGWFISVCLD